MLNCLSCPNVLFHAKAIRFVNYQLKETASGKQIGEKAEAEIKQMVDDPSEFLA